MNVLVKNSIVDVIDEIGQLHNLSHYIIKFLENVDNNSNIQVSFTNSNCRLITICDNDLENYLRHNNIDTKDILLVSTILCKSFINTMKSWVSSLESEIMR